MREPNPERRVKISIHALREEGDLRPLLRGRRRMDFYPRPPRGGRQKTVKPWSDCDKISIHALREEGDVQTIAIPVEEYKISIHALREEGDDRAAGRYEFQFISIHALREEGDIPDLWHVRRTSHFYPRPPRGGRREEFCRLVDWERISIHALREEGDFAFRYPIASP